MKKYSAFSVYVARFRWNYFSILVFSQWQRHPLQRGRQQTHRRQHPRGPYSHDCRKPYRGERHDGKGRCQSHQQEQLIFLLASLFLSGNFSFRWLIYTSSVRFGYILPEPNQTKIIYFFARQSSICENQLKISPLGSRSNKSG